LCERRWEAKISLAGQPRAAEKSFFQAPAYKDRHSDGREPSLQANSSRSDTLSISSPLVCAKTKRDVSDVFCSPRSRRSGQYQLGRALSGATPRSKEEESTGKQLAESRWRVESVALYPRHRKSFRLPSRCALAAKPDSVDEGSNPLRAISSVSISSPTLPSLDREQAPH
jgi:hypothetical protein